MLWGSWTRLCTIISLLQKQLAGSNLNRQLYIHAYLCRKYLNKLEKHVLDPDFIKFAALQPQLTQLQSHPRFIKFTMEKKDWGSYSLINFSLQIKTAILLLQCFICQNTCTFLQNEDFIRIVFVECVSRLLSGGGQWQYHTQTRVTQQLEMRVSKKSFLQNQ